MANNKIDRINKEIAKTREKITEYQNKLKGLEAQKTEAENLEIVQLVRAMRMTPQELNAMLKGDTIPGMSAAPASDEAADYEEQEDNAARFPSPGYVKITSTTAVPPKRLPSDNPSNVINGSSAFGNTCFQRISCSDIPLARAPVT